MIQLLQNTAPLNTIEEKLLELQLNLPLKNKLIFLYYDDGTGNSPSLFTKGIGI